MTIRRPVVLDAAPPFESGRSRVTVIHHPGSVNRGNGRKRVYVVRYVTAGRTEAHARLRHGRTAARRAARLVREHEPLAVWLLDYHRTHSLEQFDSWAWRPLVHAANDISAAFVGWAR